MNLEYPRLTGKELLQFLQEIGVEVVCQRGNHVIVKNGKKKVSVIPIHVGKTIDPRLLKLILRALSLSF
ncbi:MAG TPA: addiction module toxin, HicA family [Thermococcus sp.]|nr:addiction module toxin, HicA family [Thermococcus sp.]